MTRHTSAMLCCRTTASIGPAGQDEPTAPRPQGEAAPVRANLARWRLTLCAKGGIRSLSDSPTPPTSPACALVGGGLLVQLQPSWTQAAPFQPLWGFTGLSATSDGPYYVFVAGYSAGCGRGSRHGDPEGLFQSVTADHPVRDRNPAVLCLWLKAG
jgi:hypothetical protein